MSRRRRFGMDNYQRLFDLLAKEGARLAEERAKGARPEPAPVRRTLPGAE